MLREVQQNEIQHHLTFQKNWTLKCRISKRNSRSGPWVRVRVRLSHRTNEKQQKRTGWGHLSSCTAAPRKTRVFWPWGSRSGAEKNKAHTQMWPRTRSKTIQQCVLSIMKCWSSILPKTHDKKRDVCALRSLNISQCLALCPRRSGYQIERYPYTLETARSKFMWVRVLVSLDQQKRI